MSLIEYFLQLPLLSQILIIYAALINLIAFFYFGLDKFKSQINSWRVSEKTLWLLALLGGSAGSLCGMYFFRHKTKKVSFQLVLGLIIVLHLGILILILAN
jgi:uncharacterized membrane protein YsdA (DUF1294 family)